MGKFKRNRRKSVVQNVAEKLDTPGTKKGLTKEIATRERSIDFLTLMLQNLPNPDPILKKLNQDIQVYEDLLYDSRVTACVTSRKAAVKSMEWDITGEGVPESEIKFHKEYIDNYKLEDAISETLDASLFGYKPMEIIWLPDGGRIVPVKFIGKPPRWFRYDDENKLRLLTMTNMTQGEEIPDNKFIVARSEPSYDNPYGKAVLSGCYWPVMFRKNGFKFWTIFLEKYGMPFLLATADQGAKESRITEIADMLANMVQDAIAVVPEEFKVQLMEAGEGKGKADSLHKVFLDFMNLEIAMSIVGTNLTVEVQGGSYAASKSHMEVRADIIEGDKKVVEGAFNELIKLTHDINFGSTPPVFKLHAEEKIDITRAERDEKLTRSGVKFTKEYFERKYNLQEDEFEITGDPVEKEVKI